MNRVHFTSTPALGSTTTMGELGKFASDSTARADMPAATKSSMKLSRLHRRRPKRDPVEREGRPVVTFPEDHTQVFLVTPVLELVDDPDEIWWNDSEIDKINAKAYAIVKKLETGTSTRRYVTRGLEHILNQKAVEATQSEAWEAVRRAQEGDDQRQLSLKTGNNNNNNFTTADEQQQVIVSAAYMRTSWGSKMAATKRAIRDAEEIQKYTKDTRRMIHHIRTNNLFS